MRTLRAHLFWTALVALVLIVAGGFGVRARQKEGAHARIMPVLEAWIAAHLEKPAEPIADEEDAGPILVRALAAHVQGKQVTSMGDYKSLAWTEPYAAANAEALRLLEEALGRPRFADPGGKVTWPGLYSLDEAAIARGHVLVSKGDRAGAARSFLLVHRLSRLVGNGGEGRLSFRCCWQLERTVGPLLELVESPGLADPDLVGILDLMVTPQEAGRMEAEWWDRALRKDAREYVDILRPGGEVRALQRGWLPQPSIRQRIQESRSPRMPVTGLFIPTPTEVELDWQALLHARERVPVRGGAAHGWPEEKGVHWDDDRRSHESFRRSLRDEVLQPIAMEGRLALLRTATAARLYEVRNGKFPGRLEDLVPSILAEVPRSPFADVPLVLSPSNSGILIEGCQTPPGVHGESQAKMRTAKSPR